MQRVNWLTVDKRDKTLWLYEYIGTSLRTSKGFDISIVEQTIGANLLLSNFIVEQIKCGKISFDNKILKLCPQEWFREIYWCGKIIDCFKL